MAPEHAHFYHRELGAHGQERFFATEDTRGPWSNDHQHGGPPAALLARAIEREGERAGQMFVSRVTVELLRPIPLAAPLEVETEVLTEGRTVHRVAAALLSGDTQLAVALAVRVRVTELALPRVADADPDADAMRPPEQCAPFQFPFFQHERGYHTAMELRAAAGEFGRGNFDVWMRPRLALIEAEPSTALQRVMICADAGHGVGAALDTERWSFVNPDLSVHIHRAPAGEWIGMRARTWSSPLGFGMCRTTMCDRGGEFGVAVQSQVIASVSR